MKKNTKKLLDTYRNLPDEVAEQLLEFAEFLASRQQNETTELSVPEDIPRPEKESVVVAVKRLSTTYPMLDKDLLLNETAALVSQHMLQGRDAVEVINELEDIFKKQYATLLDDYNQEVSND